MAKTTAERGNYFKKQDLMNVVQALGGTTKTKDKVTDLHDKITFLTRAAGPSGATGTQEQKGHCEVFGQEVAGGGARAPDIRCPRHS